MSTVKKRRRTRIVAKRPQTQPLVHQGFQGARHLHPERLPNPTPETTVSLRLFDVTKDTLENVQKLSDTLKRLLVSGLKLKTVPDTLVSHLRQLQKLDLGNNAIADGGFPNSMKELENLIDINLSGNRLTRLPACIKKMKNLSRLNLSNNNVEDVHGMDRLLKMQILVLDNNRLSSIFKDISHMKRLEVLHCSHNNIREIGPEIKQLKALQELDLSDNKILVLPVDLFMLPNLQSFNANHNRVSKVPTFTVKTHSRNLVSQIDLSENAISKFPGHLLFMSTKLDLSSNKIKVMNWSSMKRLDYATEKQLNVDGNPLSYPPADVCGCGLRSMIQFFQESQADVKVYQGVKVLVLGSHRSGKTSLVQSLVDQQARRSEETYDAAVGIVSYETTFDYATEDDNTPGKSLQLAIWDFCGHPFYSYPHYLFFEQTAITILTFNMKTYTGDKFYEMIGWWFDWMIAKTNTLAVVLVGTHCDQINTEEQMRISDDVGKRLNAHLQHQKKLVEERIAKIENKPHISPTLSEQLKSYMSLLQYKFTVQSQVIATSAAKFNGFDKLRDAIEILASDKKLFPNVMRVIPTFWLDVETYLEKKGNSMSIPVMEWESYCKEVTQKFGMRHLLKAITQYLHETGKVVWFSNVALLKNYVFLRPSWLFETMQQIFRHDLEIALDYSLDDSFKTAGINQTRFERYKSELVDDGVIQRELCRCLLGHNIPLHANESFAWVFRLLVDAFEIGYPVSKKQRDSVYNLNVEPDADGKVRRSQILLPWYRQMNEPTEATESWNNISTRQKLSAHFRFIRYTPPGLVQLYSVRAHAEKHNLKYIAHWKDGIYARHKVEPLFIMMNSLTTETGTNSSTFRIEIRDSSSDEDEVPASVMWTIILPLLLDFEEVLHGYPGMFTNFVKH